MNKDFKVSNFFGAILKKIKIDLYFKLFEKNYHIWIVNLQKNIWSFCVNIEKILKRNKESINIFEPYKTLEEYQQKSLIHKTNMENLKALEILRKNNWCFTPKAHFLFLIKGKKYNCDLKKVK